MQLVSSDSIEKGGTSALLFHCICNGDGSITHFMYEVDEELYRGLPNLYSVCIASTENGRRKIEGGFFVKTSYTHEDDDFSNALYQVITAKSSLANLVYNENSVFLPAKLSVRGGDPLTEKEMLKTLVTQILKHSTGGTA